MTGAIQTRGTPVGGGAADKQPIFSVNPGIELEDALGELSHLLDCAQATTFELCDAAVQTDDWWGQPCIVFRVLKLSSQL